MRFPRTPKAVVFDMDGLLFDTESLYQRAIALAAAEGGHDLTSVSRSMIGRPVVQSRRLLLDRIGPDFPVDAFFEAMFQHFDRLAETDLVLKPGVIDLLDVLDELKVPRAIATSSAHHRIQSHLGVHGLGNRFYAVVGHGDYEASKPAPDPFLVAAERLGVQPQACLALEDSPNGVRSASSAGMMTVMVPDLLEPTDEIRGLCVAIAFDLHEVRQMILSSKE